VRDFGAEHPGLESVTFMVFGEADERLYKSLLKS